MDFKERMIIIRQQHEELLTRENKPVEHLGNGIYQKYQFPILTADHTPLEWRYDFSEQDNPFLTLKHLAGISKDVDLISPIIIEPICKLKTDHLGNTNPRLHSDEILIALSICALTDLNARKAMQQLRNLRGCEAHTSVIISQVDMGVLRKLGVNLTSEPVYQTKKLYHGN